ncbi:sulfotransferase [Sphingobium sp. WCS2017Hpa-17]|uniref:sulfotransferase family protein n=1 Tax=Sphingobium sp. WCS2017Hpa-17 TaxID=3073638 RepID=UPI002888FF10|nr:sulfotransferase [Sphingobium sp. WCS2017Hpa-17]
MRDIPASLEDFSPDRLMAFAKTRTGLEDFGPGHFLTALGVLTDAIRQEAQLNENGVGAMGERLVNALANRLRRVALFKAHPEIAEQRVEVAALIVGLPRTGSTMLHRLLSESPQLTAVRWWESVFPLPRDEGAGEVAGRKADAERLVVDIMSSASGFDAIHPLDAHAYDEELPLIEQSFMSNMPESMMYIPSYGEWLLGADQADAYDELIDFLKIFQWQDPSRAGQKWVLKCPHHLTAVDTVLSKFPTAAIVMTHRPITKLMPSWYSMVGSLTGAYSDADHAAPQAEHWTQRLRRNLVDMVAARNGAPARFVDVDYRDLLEQPLVEARKVLEAAGLAVDASDLDAWQGWLDGNRRDNRPSHQYSIEQYGLTRERLNADFAFYTEAYPMAAATVA